ncbi:phage tail protein [Marinobacter lacisalsi]|uniref:Phage tail protein n=1 Tax=Marinobacter lacisalsi TaxID=475979 RepID=A0ABV8QPZ0_9GAMM
MSPRFDPLPAFHFQIALLESLDLDSEGSGLSEPSGPAALAGDLSGLVAGGFSECSGLESTINVLDVQEGGVNDRVHRLPGRASFGNLTLKRGVALSETLWLWHEQFINGEGKRRDGLIMLMNEQRVPVKIWGFYNGIPTRWSGPSLNAGNSEVAVEALEIAHEKLTLLVSPGEAMARLEGAAGPEP